MATEYLTAAITADGDLSAELGIMARSTKQVIEILYSESEPTITTRSTKQVVEVLYTKIIKSLVTNIGNVTGVITSADLQLTTPDYLSVSITGIVTVGVDLKLPSLKSNITASGDIQANLIGKKQLGATIVTSATLTSNIETDTLLTASITASGNIAANLRENIEYLVSSITASGSVTAKINVPQHVGNTINLQQTVAVTLIQSQAVSQSLNLTQQIDLVFGARNLPISSSITFTQSIDVIRVLPTKSASSTLTLTQAIAEHRNVLSYLNLTQDVIGIIYFLTGDVTSVLTLTHSVSTAGTVYNLAVESQLNLTHSAIGNQVSNKTVISNLSFSQNAFSTLLAVKKYVLLQAPYELIQTSVILPNPLLDDNESLISNLTLRRSMTNVARTYVKKSNSRRLRYTFMLDRMKALEIEAFFNAYNGADIKMINWKGEIWKVNLITNPVDYVQNSNYGPHSDRTDVNLEFEGVLLNG